jgi:hypothetical protein
VASGAASRAVAWPRLLHTIHIHIYVAGTHRQRCESVNDVAVCGGPPTPCSGSGCVARNPLGPMTLGTPGIDEPLGSMADEHHASAEGEGASCRWRVGRTATSGRSGQARYRSGPPCPTHRSGGLSRSGSRETCNNWRDRSDRGNMNRVVDPDVFRDCRPRRGRLRGANPDPNPSRVSRNTRSSVTGGNNLIQLKSLKWNH